MISTELLLKCSCFEDGLDLESAGVVLPQLPLRGDRETRGYKGLECERKGRLRLDTKTRLTQEKIKTITPWSKKIKEHALFWRHKQNREQRVMRANVDLETCPSLCLSVLQPRANAPN